MNRRKTVLALLAFGVAPLVAEAQAEKVWRIGWLQPVALPPSYVDAFRQGLRELGYVESKNILFEYRWADGKLERLPGLASELVRLKMDVIVSGNTSALQALKRATTTIPIIMLGPGDPVAIGLIESLARPGGNITGMTNIPSDLSGKLLDLLKQLVPGLSRVAWLANKANPMNLLSLRGIEDAGRALGVSVQALAVRGPDEIGPAFSTMIKDRAEALIIAADTMLVAETRRIVDFATKYRLPSISFTRLHVDAGGLLAYGVNYADTYRATARYVDKVLKGRKPADLPVEQPTKIQLVINLKAAKPLGITIPQSLLLRADEVIN
jgi:putative tryptophan/tyrosine transport system substrate-binding protein